LFRQRPFSMLLVGGVRRGTKERGERGELNEEVSGHVLKT